MPRARLAAREETDPDRSVPPRYHNNPDLSSEICAQIGITAPKSRAGRTKAAGWAGPFRITATEQGQSIGQAIAWAEDELEGFMRG